MKFSCIHRFITNMSFLSKFIVFKYAIQKMKYYISAHFVVTVFNVPVITIRTARNNWYDVKAILILKYTMRKTRPLYTVKKYKNWLNTTEKKFWCSSSIICYLYFIHVHLILVLFFSKKKEVTPKLKIQWEYFFFFILMLSYFTSNLLPRGDTAWELT